MKFAEALEALKSGYKIKLPEWEGYWQLQNNEVMIHCRDGVCINLLDTKDVVYTLSNITREDWEITEKSNINITATMRFGEALLQLQQGNRVTRKGWNGKGIYLELQYPESSNKMTQPYIYIVTTDLITNNPHSPKGIVPWVASQTDMLAEDWIIVNSTTDTIIGNSNNYENIKIGTIVKVTQHRKEDLQYVEYIPIGTICRIINIDPKDNYKFKISPVDLGNQYAGYWYHKDEFEIVDSHSSKEN